MSLKINDKIMGISGCIGRRGYFVNLMYVNIFVSLLNMPFTLWMLKSSSAGTELFNMKCLLATAPMFCKFFYVLSCLLSLGLGFGLIVRRLTDIRGEKPDFRTYLAASLLVIVPFLLIVWLSPWVCLLLLIACVFGLIILFVPGKITSQLPPNPLMDFNWGAFWGTWIWGLFNKTYVTLIAVPLFFTPAFPAWALICGFKGNEWAFKNTKALESENFHRGQKNQAIFWNVFAGFLFFILPVIFVLLIVALAAFSAKNPQMTEDFLSKAEYTIETIIVSQFEDYELDANENKFYVEPRYWAGLTFDERYKLFKNASSFASLKKTQSGDVKFEGYSGTKTDEMLITKFYSSYNGEVLAEFEIDESQITGFSSALKAFITGLKFNPHPQLPPPLEE